MGILKPNFQPRWPRASQAALVVKNLPASAGDTETQVSSLGGEGSLEEGMETHCGALAWRVPWTEEPGGHSPQGRKEPDTAEVTELVRGHVGGTR